MPEAWYLIPCVVHAPRLSLVGFEAVPGSWIAVWSQVQPSTHRPVLAWTDQAQDSQLKIKIGAICQVFSAVLL